MLGVALHEREADRELFLEAAWQWRAGSVSCPGRPGGRHDATATRRRSRCHSRVRPRRGRRRLKQADLALWHAPDAPVRVNAGPGTLTELNESLGEAIPRRAVAEHVLLGHGATIPGVRRRLPEFIDVLLETPRYVSTSSAIVCAVMAGPPHPKSQMHRLAMNACWRCRTGGRSYSPDSRPFRGGVGANRCQARDAQVIDSPIHRHHADNVERSGSDVDSLISPIISTRRRTGIEPAWELSPPHRF